MKFCGQLCEKILHIFFKQIMAIFVPLFKNVYIPLIQGSLECCFMLYNTNTTRYSLTQGATKPK